LGTAFASLKPDAPAKEKSALATRRIALVIPQTIPHIPRSTPIIPKINPPMPGKRFDIFGSFAFKTQTSKFASQWAGVLKRVQIERPFYKACEKPSADCPAALVKWRHELNMLRPLPRLVQLRRLNRFVNHLAAYSDDNVTFGARDHWASPLEFLKGRGDCEDFAIFKFFGLLELGFKNDQLRIAMVKDRRRNLLHAVLTVEIAGETYVLDNLNNQVRTHDHLLKYVPQSSFNLVAHWAHIVTDQIRTKFQRATDKTITPEIICDSTLYKCQGVT